VKTHPQQCNAEVTTGFQLWPEPTDYHQYMLPHGNRRSIDGFRCALYDMFEWEKVGKGQQTGLTSRIAEEVLNENSGRRPYDD